MGAYESGRAFIDQVLAKIPEDKRAAAKALFDDPGAKDAVTLVGDGALARTDYSKSMDTVAKQKADLDAKLANLNEWFTDNEAALKEYTTIKPEYDKLKTTGEKPKPDETIDPRKVAEQVLSEQGRDYLAATAWLNDRARAHERMFPGETFDSLAMLNDPRLGKPVSGQPGRIVSLPDLYEEKYGEKVRAKQKEDSDRKFNDEVTKRVTEEIAKRQSQPFPLRSDASPSVLDHLSDDKRTEHSVDSATALYESLQAARG